MEIGNQNRHMLMILLIVFLAFMSSMTSVAIAQETSYSIAETQITTNGKALLPDIYADKIAYIVYHDNGYLGDIYLYDLSTQHENLVATGTGSSVDICGGKIVWTFDNNGVPNIYMYDFSTSQVTQITNDGKSRSPKIYGDKIVYQVDYQSDNTYSDIYMYDISTSQKTQLTSGTVAISPHIYGDKIVWCQNYDIYTYNISTGQEPIQITYGGRVSGIDIYGDKIVWTGDQNVIHLYDLSTSNDVTIASTNYSSVPAIYKDRVVWSDYHDSHSSDDIFMYNISTGQKTQITSNGHSRDPNIFENMIVYRNYGGTVGFGTDVYMSTLTIQESTEESLVQVQGSSEVYLIENGMKRQFTSPEALEWNGYSFSDVIEISSETLASIPNGADISITQAIIDKYHALGGSPIFGQLVGTGELNGEPDSAENYCSYVNFQNGAIDCFKNGPHVGEAYAIFNPFFTKWKELGYGSGILGYPIEDMSEPQISKYGTSFRYQNFANGDELGALELNLSSGNVVAIHGAIFAKWGVLGYANSVLGLVTSDERDAVTSFKGTTGKVSDFENGHLQWHGSGDHYMATYTTYGELDDLYASMGGTASELGFPIMDQITREDGYEYCEFEGGNIEWDDTTGNYKVKLFIAVGQGADTPEIEQLFIDAYNRNGGSSVLGEPTAVVHEAFGYQVQDFPGASGIPGGAIMYNPIKNEAFYIHGAIWEKYYNYPDKAQLGPVAEDEKEAAKSPQGTTGKYTKFETGTIHWISNEKEENVNNILRGESFVTFGYLDELYTKNGGSFGKLGFPVMDEINRIRPPSQEYCPPGHGYCEFEGGYIEWNEVEQDHIVYSENYAYKPDLVVTDIVFSNDNPAEGEPITVTAKIKNIGLVDVKDKIWIYFWQVSYYDKPDGIGERGLVSIYSGPGLASGKEVEAQITWNVGSVFTTQEGVFEVQIDPEHTIDEKNDDNNIKYGKVTVTSNSNFKPEIDGYHFKNFEMTESEIKEMKANIEPLDLGILKIPNLKDNIFADLEKSATTSGNCYGMAASSILYFRKMVPKPVESETFDMLKNNEVKQKIYDHQTTQLAYIVQVFITGFFQEIVPVWQYDSNYEYKQIHESLENNKPVLLLTYYFKDPNSMVEKVGLGHSIVAFDEYEVSDKIKNVLVYDSNYPGMSRVMQFDLENRKISYDLLYKNEIRHVGHIFTKDPLKTPEESMEALKCILQESYEALLKYLDESKSKMLIFNCPINVTITDQYGRIIDDKDNNTIPSGNVNIIGDSKMFLLPADLDYKIHIDAYDSGEFTFSQINPLTDEYASVVSFVNISITENTEAICEITSKDSEYKMEIDYDGDGSIDELITPDVIDIVGTNFYNITFFSPVTTVGQFNLTNGAILPIKFTAENSTTNEFAYDDTVNVTITNSTGHLVTYFRNGTGTENVRINPNEKQYMVDLDTRNYDMKVGENYTITAIFGKPNSLRGYALSHFTLIKDTSLPQVDFTANSTSGAEPLNVKFTDLSTEAAVWEWDFGDGTPISNEQNPLHTYADNGEYTVTLRVTDNEGGVGTDTLTVTVNNVNPVIDTITLPINPCKVNTPVAISCIFTDAGILDTHAVVWDWGDSTNSAGVVTETNGAGTVTGEHTYTKAGIYKVSLIVTDDDGGTVSKTSESYVVVYDSTSGFVTGGGWITSPAGAYVVDSTMSGKATFEFASMYKKKATKPTGIAMFQLKLSKVGNGKSTKTTNLNFKSTSYDWLVVSGNQAKCKGTGTINGKGNYGFMISIVDGKNKKNDIDKFRIKIWDKASGKIVYDNQMGASEDAEPTTVIGGGSIVVQR